MTYKLHVDNFSVVDPEADGGRGLDVTFEVDPDLYLGCGRALGNVPGRRIANQAALVLVELGIDGSASHRVRVDHTGNMPGPNDDPALFADAFNYPRGGGYVEILTDAIESLTALRDQLEAFRSAEEYKADARDAGRLGRCSRCGMTEVAMVHRATANGHPFSA